MQLTTHTVNTQQDDSNTDTHPKVSAPRIMLHVEGLVVFITSLAAYGYLGGNWWIFFGLLLAPDLAFAIYVLNKSAGITAYNLVHTYSVPLVLGMVAVAAGWQFGLLLCIIWATHIGMDRTVGYGLKYQTGFKDTHLKRI